MSAGGNVTTNLQEDDWHLHMELEFKGVSPLSVPTDSERAAAAFILQTLSNAFDNLPDGQKALMLHLLRGKKAIVDFDLKKGDNGRPIITV